MKVKITQFDELTQKLEEAQGKIETKKSLIMGKDKLEKIQKATKNLKLQLFKIDQRIGIIKTIIPYKEVQEEENHHLYDDLFDL